ncbi:MAG TPA: ABC transporter permease [Candidatus Dormibacteraeota bacterium]|nr:ABC transporter permease [Candidatus Dormibacteraeota bacterium]
MLRTLLLQTRAEMLKFWRVPVFGFFSVGLPLIIFTFFGLRQATQPLAAGSAITVGTYVMASMAAYTVGNVMVFSFGMALAIERGQKQDLLLRASPLPASIYLLAKIINAVLFALLALIVLFVFAHFTAQVTLGSATWVNLTLRLLLGSIPFIGLGLGFGYLAGPNSAPAVINFVYLPIAFASGIFIPVNQLPDFIRNIAPYLPLNPFVQLGWDAIGLRQDRPVSTDVLYLVAYSVGFFVLAVWAYRRDQGIKFT